MQFFKSILRRETVTDTAGQEVTEEVEMSVEISESPVWETIARWSLYLIVFFTPFWFLPFTIAPLDINKTFLVSVLAIVGFIAWLGRAVYSGRVMFPKTMLGVALVVWLVVLLVSSIFSVSPSVSLWADEVSAFFNSAMLVLVALLAAATLQKGSDFATTYLLLFAAATLVMVFELIQMVFGFNMLPWAFAQGRAFNPIGSLNSLGIFFFILLVTVVPFLEDARTTLSRSLFGAIALVSFLFVVLVNFAYVWAAVGLVSLVLLAYSLSRTGGKKFVGALVLLLVSVLLYLATNQVGVLLSRDNGSRIFDIPLDATPNFSTTLQLGKNALKDHAMLGYCPGTFEYIWDSFKDRSFNDTAFWSFRFASGSSLVATLLATTGILGVLAFLGVLVLFLVLGMRVLGNSQEGTDKVFGLASFSGSLFLLSSWFFYPVTASIAILTFLSMGMLIAHAVRFHMIEQVSVPILSDSVKGFVSALLIILLMVFGVVGLYISGEKYLASVFYGKGLIALQGGNVNTAEIQFSRAVSFDSGKDQYYRSLAQVSFAKLQRTLENAGNKAPDDVRNESYITLSNAISNAKAATNANPVDAINWQLLGQIHEAVMPFVDGAGDVAIDAYKKAIERAPTSPALRDDISRVYITQGNYVEANVHLEEAVKLKADYTVAHFRMAQIAALKGNVKDATRNAENAALTAPNDIGVLFQLGLLYYQQNRIDEAGLILERVVALNKNYSNARYFLGLAYANKKQIQKAIAEFEEVLKLNPGNKEVETILANLRAGKDPLATISPPAPTPDKRDNPPIREDIPATTQKTQ